MMERPKSINAPELPPSDPRWHEYLDAALPIARAAGDLLAESFGHARTVELKGAIDLVTEMDRRAEDLIVTRLAKSFPDFAIIAEEGSIRNAANRFAWYVDPLDGTTNYAHGLPLFCVSLGLVFDTTPICGIIYHPMDARCSPVSASEVPFCTISRCMSPQQQS